MIRRSLKDLKKDKRGNVRDMFYVLAILFASAIGIFLAYFTFAQIAPGLSASTNQTVIIDQTTDALKSFDTMFVLFFVGNVLYLMISAFFIKSHPIFFGVGIVSLAIAILIAVIIANVHSEIRNSPEFSEEMKQFSTTNFIINRLPVIALILGIVILIILYGKPFNGSPSGGTV